MAIPRWRIGSGALLAAVLVLLFLTLPITLTPGLRQRLTAGLSERFDSDVELGTLRVAVLPRLRVSGADVVLRHKGRTDVPPLITVSSFSAEASLFGLIGRSVRLQRVHLDGLEINVPPGGMKLDDDDGDDRRDRAGEPVAAPAATGDAPEPTPNAGADPDELADEPRNSSPLIVDELLSERALLRILRDSPDKEPRVFEIHRLSMQDAGSHAPWAFRAALSNPTPPGEIETHGTFGPWNAPHPAATPLDAEYEFRDADLGVFEGIHGTLHSTGAFSGVLERIEVEGRADVPEFALDEVGNPVSLQTRFRSIIDGTNGNTWLKPVEAMLQETLIIASGGVVERDGEKGRTVTLEVVMDEARIEDVLRLAVKTQEAPMTGGLKLTTTFVLPPGPGAAIEKMRLDGAFEIAQARFTGGNVQAKVNELSQKARADDSDDEPSQVVSDFKGRFVMRGGVLRFSNVSFAVPGARVDVSGTYALRAEALDFRGTVRLDAKLSDLTTGMKSFLLRLVDPLVRRKDVTVIPVTIGGTVGDPKFGVDFRRAFTPG